MTPNKNTDWAIKIKAHGLIEQTITGNKAEGVADMLKGLARQLMDTHGGELWLTLKGCDIWMVWSCPKGDISESDALLNYYGNQTTLLLKAGLPTSDQDESLFPAKVQANPSQSGLSEMHSR